MLPSLAILGACLAWGIDNNLTRMVSLNDASWIAATKGLVAGPVNLVIAFALGAQLPPLLNVGAAMGVGLFAYGVSLVLFIVALRHVGTARAGAYYSLAPFFGAVLALLLGEEITVPLVIASLLMGVGLWLHLSERHEHTHSHLPGEHAHEHSHNDGHHEHFHEPPLKAGAQHSHAHVHDALTHAHPHYPDTDHRHTH